MAGKWDYSLISRIQQASDIVDVISEHMNLEKKGKEMVGLCPFHTDHRPSLFVSPAKQIFKCFACGAGGDVIKFVQMKENLTFPQAVQRLANRAGISIDPIRTQRSGNNVEELDTATLANMNSWALKHWMHNLWDAERGTETRKYIKSRGLTEQTAKKWQLGLAADAWDDLTSKAARDKRSAQRLIQAGLGVEKDSGSCYDKFRNRLMFPIVDATGRVIGFGGRTLGDDPAKYMNSPATALFDKSQALYGLYQARRAITETETAIVVEGYTDVMMAHQCGIDNVVAALGTSFTSGHANILRRYAKHIVLVFDSDVAGKAAANRALEVCLEHKVNVRLAFVPEGKDPCDYLLEAGPVAFRNVIESAEDVLEFKWKVLNEQLQSGQNLSDRTEAVRQFLQVAAAAFEARSMDSVSRAVVVSRLSELMGVSSSYIEREIADIQKQRHRNGRQAENNDRVSDRSQDLISKARCEILETLIAVPNSFPQVAKRLSVNDFGPDDSIKELARILFELLAEDNVMNISKLYGRIESTQTAKLLTELQKTAEQKQDLKEQLEGALKVIEKQRLNIRVQTIENQHDNDKELKTMLRKIAQNGPNLRSAGL